MKSDTLYNQDCIEGMARIAAGSIDLAFADPPFNIGYKYDVYEDRLAADEYLNWTKKWGAALIRTLKPNGAFWLAIGDDFAAELKLLFQRELGLVCRSWVIWYYTFGVNCKYKFSRSHTHLFHFVKDPEHFTFNRDAIRVPSARQLVYSDSRANSKGRLPDDTWILRPQDALGSFTPEENVWYFPRVCGTFKERAGWHGCQMPEQLLGRIIKVSSNPGDIILEPFGGSGTTLAVAKKLDRRFIGFELSKNYAAQIQRRLDATAVGDSLSGAEEPMVTAPQTAAGKPLPKPRTAASRRQAPQRNTSPIPTRPVPSKTRLLRGQLDRGVMDAFLATRSGFPVDRVIADPELNEQYIAKCSVLGLPGRAVDWNHRLMHLRKAGYLKGLPPSLRTKFTLEEQSFDRYKFACEIAMRRFVQDQAASLDHVLCDPAMARHFDEYVLTMLPDNPGSLMIRWFALRIRKEVSKRKKLAAHRATAMARDEQNPFSLDWSQVPDSPGLYWLSGDGRHLYVGEAGNLRERFEVQFGHRKFDFWSASQNKLLLSFKRMDATLPHQSRWISKWRPEGNFEKWAAA